VIEIRLETEADCASVRRVNILAFGQELEADLVDQLRRDHAVIASLVAVEGNDVLGHILFSRVWIDTPKGAVPAASLAPMAVHPDHQRQGIGSNLVRRGLDILRSAGERVVVVVGHPEYYPRFGFLAEPAKRLDAPWSGEAWMALELIPGALEGVQGIVKYPAAFESHE
jgi:putative acetyltransferase